MSGDEITGPDGTPITNREEAARALGRWIADPTTDKRAVDQVIASLVEASRAARDTTRTKSED